MEEKQKILLKISMEIEDCFRKYFPQIVNKYRWVELSDTYTKIGIFADDLKGDIESAIGFTVQSISATLEENGYSTEKMDKYFTMKAYKEYINYIWEVDQLYVDMFNSLSSNSVAVFKAQERYKADLDRSYGIVTNSIATLALYELTQGVIDASKEAKNYGRALSDFRADYFTLGAPELSIA